MRGNFTTKKFEISMYSNRLTDIKGETPPRKSKFGATYLTSGEACFCDEYEPWCFGLKLGVKMALLPYISIT
jgi:hypothetical protein